jgi:glycosyltransferase A (GT-A) superfamily protein (DUF2064 family)
MTTLVLIAKEPIPGRVKTRLHPPLSYEQAAELAAAAIDDTLRAMRDLPATRRILLFEGTRPPVAAEGYEVVPQSTGGLDERLAAIFDRLDEPTLLIGMDTPQLTAADLAPAFGDGTDRDRAGGSLPESDVPDGIDAWFGPAADGGWWALGMREPDGDLIRGIPTSRDDTGALQLARLRGAGLRVGLLPELVDVDTIDDALVVAAAAPTGGFAATLARFAPALRLENAS